MRRWSRCGNACCRSWPPRRSPQRPEQRSNEAFDWTLYRVTVPVGGIVVEVEVALSEADDRTNLVLVQSAPDEFETIREQVFIPAIDAFDVLAPEPTVDPATLSYTAEEVTFPGGAAEVELAGTLTLPPGAGPHPVVVLMSGSGPQDRDELLAPLSAIKPFAMIADALTSAGVAVLRYDDRGVGSSTGDYAAATVSDLAGDGSAAIDYLTTRSDIDQDQIGILGHSEGGFYSAIIAPDDARVAFVVLMAPPAVDGVDLLVAQNEAVLRSNGETEAEIDYALVLAKSLLPAIRDGDRDAATALIEAYLEGLWERLDADARAIAGDRDTWISSQVQTQLASMESDWYRSLLAFDPQPGLSRITVPVQGLFGGKDVQVVLDQNEPALRSALDAAGNDDFEIVVFPNANHLFQEAEIGSVQEYADLPTEFTPDFLPALVAWVTAHVEMPA